MAIERKYVPWIGRDYVLLSFGVLLLCMQVWYVISEPRGLPSTIGLVIGVVSGVPGGLIIGRAFVAYLSDIATLTPDRPWLRWAWPLVYYTPPIRSGMMIPFKVSWRFMGIGYGAYLISIGLAGGLFLIASRFIPPCWLWTTPGGEVTISSSVQFGGVWWACVCTVMLIQIAKALIWYRRLPV